MDKQEILSRIDSTELKPTATEREILQLCEDAKQYRFAAVCVHPRFVSLCARELAGTSVKVATVVGFPQGANTSACKAFETAEAVKNGASEIDMVLAIGAVKQGDFDYVRRDIEAVVQAAGGACVKVILETCFLSEEEIERACLCAAEAGAHFVKTSTGFGAGGAQLSDIAVMKRAVGGRCQIKASGGIRTLEACEAFLSAGADRIGTGSGAKIAREE
ncbi:MAG: deoxyribose-phosphate aldolase [Clostridiales bacterium]|nr:deoxyribose-phosphate aldolase [Clostridiales bacterium]